MIAADDPPCRPVGRVMLVIACFFDCNEDIVVVAREVAINVNWEGAFWKPQLQKILQMLVVGKAGRVMVNLAEHEVAGEKQLLGGL